MGAEMRPSFYNDITKGDKNEKSDTMDRREKPA